MKSQEEQLVLGDWGGARMDLMASSPTREPDELLFEVLPYPQSSSLLIEWIPK